MTMVAAKEVRACSHADAERHLRSHGVAIGRAANPVGSEEFPCHCARCSAFRGSNARSRPTPRARGSRAKAASSYRRMRSLKARGQPAASMPIRLRQVTAWQVTIALQEPGLVRFERLANTVDEYGFRRARAFERII